MYCLCAIDFNTWSLAGISASKGPRSDFELAPPQPPDPAPFIDLTQPPKLPDPAPPIDLTQGPDEDEDDEDDGNHYGLIKPGPNVQDPNLPTREQRAQWEEMVKVKHFPGNKKPMKWYLDDGRTLREIRAKRGKELGTVGH